MIEVSVTPIYKETTTSTFFKLRLSRPIVDVIYHTCKKLLIELPFEDTPAQQSNLCLDMLKIKKLMITIRGNLLDLDSAKAAIELLNMRIKLNQELIAQAPLNDGTKWKKRKLNDIFYLVKHNHAIIYNEGNQWDMIDARTYLSLAVKEVESKQQ